MLAKAKIVFLMTFVLFFYLGVILTVGCSSVYYNRLSKRKLEKTMMLAVKGDGEAALLVERHFSIGYNDSNDATIWDTIGAENDYPESQYGLAYTLLDYSHDPESKLRGIFWLYKMVVIGYRDAEEWLEKKGYTLDTAQPPDDSLFPYEYTQLSETELEDCKTGALRGNKKTALILGKYYEEIEINNELSEYWYRIGAQNGNPECQYILGQIMSDRDDQLDQVRGKFWLDRAVSRN